ncbi:MAG: PQQ-binding-like beta-propeller repeat protein [Planctomycetota bacterium]|nr:PQQ-binding-like beta-propeller repeat protein [Planctomycetota bacterium]
MHKLYWIAIVALLLMISRNDVQESAQAAPKAKGAVDTTATTKTSASSAAPQLDMTMTGELSAVEAAKKANSMNRPGDHNQWGASPLRNNVSDAKNVATEWEVGEFDDETGVWNKDSSKNIKWGIPLGSQTYGNTVVANGKVYVGTNNGAAYLKDRYPAEIDLGVLLCFDEKDGKFLWQDSSEKLHTGRVNDWPLMGTCSSPLVEGDRVWFVSSRGEVKCLDANGFHDDKNNGPVTDEKFTGKNEADVIWVYDMMKQLGVSQHNMANCSIAVSGDYLFVNTSNGVDEGHLNLPSPRAASFIALDKNNGKLIWSDNSPGPNVLHGQWSSPAYAVLGGVPQVLFGGGDGWVYSFDARGENGKSKLLWKFDCNPKDSKYTLGGRADRNHLIATPVIYNGKVFIGVGEDPEHGEGVGHLWCIDPTKRGDVSPELVFNSKDPEKPIEHKRNQAMVKEDGDFARPNPNSAAVWHYENHDFDGNGKISFEESMHRTCGTVAIANDLLFVADFSGLVHCVDVKTGKPYWTHDMLSAAWGSPLIVEDRLYIGDEDGEVSILKVAKELEVIGEVSMGNAVYSTPIVANGVLYISNKSFLFAIEAPKQAASVPGQTPGNVAAAK